MSCWVLRDVSSSPLVYNVRMTVDSPKTIKVADRVEVTVDLKGKRVSGPPVDLKQ